MLSLTVFVLSIIVRFSYGSVGPGATKFTIARPEGERTYWVYVPSNYTAMPSVAFPLFIGFHGLGDDCTNFGVGMKQLSEQRNFLFAYPCGFNGQMGTAFNAGTCCLSGTSIDDVAFTRAIVGQVSSNLRVDKNRIFAFGFSNGAMMSEALACEAADLVSAVASVSGITAVLPGNNAGLQQCSKDFANFRKPVSVVNIHGDSDWIVPWTGDPFLGFPDVPSDMNAWASRNGCESKSEQTFTRGAFTEWVYPNCTNGVSVRLVKNQGGGHYWPVDSDFDSGQYITDFFLGPTRK